MAQTASATGLSSKPGPGRMATEQKNAADAQNSNESRHWPGALLASVASGEAVEQHADPLLTAHSKTPVLLPLQCSFATWMPAGCAQHEPGRCQQLQSCLLPTAVCVCLLTDSSTHPLCPLLCPVQLPWPWLIFKALICPASVLGANETLFQGEEPADVCCLQPYSFCGPTCRCVLACAHTVVHVRQLHLGREQQSTALTHLDAAAKVAILSSLHHLHQAADCATSISMCSSLSAGD